MATPKKFKIVIYGAGAIGTTLAAWMTESGCDVSLLTRRERASKLRQQGVTITKNNETLIEDTKLNIIDQLDPNDHIDLLIITVKNFNLEQSSQEIVEAIGSDTLVLGLQNGVINQEILPNYFSKVIYGIVNYNAWQSSSKQNTITSSWNVNINGPIVLGTPDNSMKIETLKLVSIFSTFISCYVSKQFQDDAHSKLVANLGNAVTTIIGNSHLEASALIPLQSVLTKITFEGVKTLKVAGYKETISSPLPSWRLIMSSVYIPLIFTRSVFRTKLALIGSTSMANDILTKASGVSELQSINGYLLDLASQHNVDVPYSKRLYKLCQQRFGNSPFKAITAQELCDSLSGALVQQSSI
jgi:2-dehydropantoate 2-reductase